jgi:GNAT superfamily N-acetyltransferase
MSDPTVRRAAPTDCQRIAAVHMSTWRGAYRGLVPDATLDDLQLADFEARWAERLGDAAARHTTWVVERDGEVVGFAACGPYRDEPLPAPETLELYAIYILPDAWGAGRGAALVSAVREAARAEGARRLLLWVLENNHRGRAFYERHGFAPDGTARVRPRGEAQLRELRYARAL